MKNLLAKGSVVLHDDRHIKKRHIGLFAANLTDVIRGRAKPRRSPTNHLFLSPHRSQSPPPRKYSSYSDAVRKFSPGDHHQPTHQRQQQQSPSMPYFQSQAHQPASSSITNWQLPVHPDNGNVSQVELPKELLSFFRFIKSFI